MLTITNSYCLKKKDLGEGSIVPQQPIDNTYRRPIEPVLRRLPTIKH